MELDDDDDEDFHADTTPDQRISCKNKNYYEDENGYYQLAEIQPSPEELWCPPELTCMDGLCTRIVGQ